MCCYEKLINVEESFKYRMLNCVEKDGHFDSVFLHVQVNNERVYKIAKI